MQDEFFGKESAQLIEEKHTEKKPTRHPWAWLMERVFAVEFLVCVHCAGTLRLVEIATEAAAIKRLIRGVHREDRRVSSCLRFGESHRRDAAGLRESEAAGGWGECGMSEEKRCSRRENAR